MLFPETERIVFAKNPLVQVICQLRFPPILEITTTEPAHFQSIIRGRYPFYEKTDAAIPKDIAALLSQLSIVSPISEGLSHRFIAEGRTREISLTREFVSVTTTSYTSWDHFRVEILLAKEALESIYKPSFYSRIGLRYRDVIDRDILGLTNEPWQDLIKPSIVGILSEEAIATSVRSQQSRAVIGLNEIGGTAVLQHGLSVGEEGKQTYGIDADFFTEERTGADGVLAVLDRFNRTAGNFFRWAISDKLAQALGRATD